MRNYKTKLEQIRRTREVVEADERRRAENHAYLLSLLPSYAKEHIVIESKATQK